MVFQCINIRQVPWEVLKTAAFGLGYQHLPRDLANVNVWKTMFDPYMYIPVPVNIYGVCILARQQIIRKKESTLRTQCLLSVSQAFLFIDVEQSVDNGIGPVHDLS